MVPAPSVAVPATLAAARGRPGRDSRSQFTFPLRLAADEGRSERNITDVEEAGFN